MLWALIVILVILWIIGFIVVHVTSAAIHLLLVAAAIVLIWRLLAGRRAF